MKIKDIIEIFMPYNCRRICRKKEKVMGMMKKYLVLFYAVLFLMISGGISSQTTSKEESGKSENKLPNEDLLLGVDVYYSDYDTLTKLKAKNPGIKFSQIKKSYDTKGRTGFETVLGHSPITTEASFIFNSEGHLDFVQILKKGASLNIYDPLVKKYTQIYGEPKKSNPLTTNLSQNVSSAFCKWENGKRVTWIILVVPLSDNEIPFIRLFEFWDMENPLSKRE